MYSILAGKGLMEGQRRKLQLQEQQRLLQLLEDHNLQENVVVRWGSSPKMIRLTEKKIRRCIALHTKLIAKKVVRNSPNQKMLPMVLSPGNTELIFPMEEFK